jgi:uncharacterized protein YgbK (DUF1537 family)
MARGARLVSLEASSDGDLDAIVTEGRLLGKRILWAGSGGLAAALARSMPPGPGFDRREPRRGPVLFCIGSDHPVTLLQQERLLAERGVRRCSLGEIVATLRRGEHAFLRIPREGIAAALLRDIPPAALILSGGDTASAVCEAIGARAIELCDEIAPGIPRGVLRGGERDGLAVVTKSGGFGGADALIQVADFFSKARRSL